MQRMALPSINFFFFFCLARSVVQSIGIIKTITQERFFFSYFSSSLTRSSRSKQTVHARVMTSQAETTGGRAQKFPPPLSTTTNNDDDIFHI
jgi:hypothetical protein